MPRAVFWLALLALVLAGIAYPLHQAAVTGGLVYYSNGNDETSYLQYDFARATAGIARPGQWLVVGLHALGLSGGWQNLLFDVTAPTLLVIGLAWLFVRLGYAPERARLAALAMAVVPILASGVNPLIARIAERRAYSPAIRWLNMVDHVTPALLRTPEPQVSWLLVLGATLVAVRWRAVWPLLAVTPFCYPFVALPVAFVALAVMLHRRWQAAGKPGAVAGPLVLAYLAVGAAAALYYGLFVPSIVRVILVDSRFPMVSVSSLLALAAYALCRRAIPENFRFVALAAALAPLAACNQQVLSGHLAQPDDYEHFAGVLAVALVPCLAVAARPVWLRGLATAGLALAIWEGGQLMRANENTNGPLPPDPALVAALREDPRHVAIDDINTASSFNLLFAREATTALSYDQTFLALSDRYLPEYRCVRRHVLAEQAHDPGFRFAIQWLDHSFAYGSQDFALAHVGRKTHFVKLKDPVNGPCEPNFDQRPLRYFFVRRP